MLGPCHFTSINYNSSSSIACLKTVDGCPIFESKFTAAVQAILNHRGVNEVNDFFKLVMDFSGINNRFGQVAVPDFLEHLAGILPNLFNPIKCRVDTTLRCGKCKWISHSLSNDFLFKLYFPPGLHTGISLLDLWKFNVENKLGDFVFCGKCNQKTHQTSTLEMSPDIFLIVLWKVKSRIELFGRRMVHL